MSDRRTCRTPNQRNSHFRFWHISDLTGPAGDVCLEGKADLATSRVQV